MTTTKESTPTGGYETSNGEVRVSGWGASLMAKGTNVVALVILILGLIGLGATNWYALRLMRDEIHDHMLTVDKSAAEGSQRRIEISEEHRLLTTRLTEDNNKLIAAVREAVQAVEASVWVNLQDERTRRQLNLPEPPGIRAMRSRPSGWKPDR